MHVDVKSILNIPEAQSQPKPQTPQPLPDIAKYVQNTISTISQIVGSVETRMIEYDLLLLRTEIEIIILE